MAETTAEASAQPGLGPRGSVGSGGESGGLDRTRAKPTRRDGLALRTPLGSNARARLRAAEVPHGAPPPPAVLGVDVGIDWQTGLVSPRSLRGRRIAQENGVEFAQKTRASISKYGPKHVSFQPLFLLPRRLLGSHVGGRDAPKPCCLNHAFVSFEKSTILDRRGKMEGLRECVGLATSTRRCKLMTLFFRDP